MEITTSRLLLRIPRQSDFEIYAAYYADPETARFVGGQMDRIKAWRHLAALAGHWTLKGFGVWAVQERAHGAFIGCIGLWEPEGWPEIELGYWLVREKQGHGLAKEAALAARDHAYSTMGLRTLVSYIDPANSASRRLAESLGATFEKTIDLAGLGDHCVYRHPPPS